LLQEFDLEIKDKKESKNLIAYHLSKIPNSKEEVRPILKEFPNEKKKFIKSAKIP